MSRCRNEHFLLRCHFYSPKRRELFENLEKVELNFLNLNIKDKVSFLLYGFQSATSKDILKVLYYLQREKI